LPVDLSLLDKARQVQLQSGLNWGYSNGNVCLEDACIPLNTDTIRNNPGLFNPISIDNRIYVTWDDGIKMVCLLEGRQTNLIGNQQYAKQISSDDDKSIIGHYIRTRIGIFGRRITTQDLVTYGRTSISVLKTGYDTYEFDFS